MLRGMNSDSVDLIYLDPPFNSKKDYAAPIGGGEAIVAFKDTWHLSDVDLAWHEQLRHDNSVLHDIILTAWLAAGKKTASYLMMMAVRLLEMKRVLKDTGSIYLHCDPTESHYLKMLMDAIFGRKNFRNEIVWAYTGPGSPKMRQFNRKHDIILWYNAGDTWTFNGDEVRLAYDKATVTRGKYDSNSPTTGSGLRDVQRGKIPESWWRDIPSGGQISKKELVGWPTQKPLALLERIIKASSNPGDVVLDPFCGCATTPIAAEKLDRQWVGIDLSPLANDLVRKRFRDELRLFSELTIHRTITGKGVEKLMRTDLGKLPPYRSHKKALFGEQEGFCNGCGYDWGTGEFDVDHIIATGKGGTDHKANLQLLCRGCNRKKKDGEMSDLIAELIEDRIGQWA